VSGGCHVSLPFEISASSEMCEELVASQDEIDIAGNARRH